VSLYKDLKLQFPGSRTAISGHRYYNPTLGRFLGRDEIGEKGGFHLYAFCRNNAVNGWDKLGMYLDTNLSDAQRAAYAAGYAKDPSAYTMTPDQYSAWYNYQMSRLQTNSCGPSCGGGGFMNGAFANEVGGGSAIGASIDAGNAQSAQLTTLANADKPQTRVYNYNGKTYVVTNDQNSMAPAGSSSYNVSAGGGAPIGITSNGQMVSLGVVGDESDPVNVANAPGSAEFNWANGSIVSASMAASSSTYGRSDALGVLGNQMQSSGLGGTLTSGARLGEYGTMGAIGAPILLVAGAPVAVAAGQGVVSFAGTMTTATKIAAVTVGTDLYLAANSPTGQRIINFVDGAWNGPPSAPSTAAGWAGQAFGGTIDLDQLIDFFTPPPPDNGPSK